MWHAFWIYTLAGWLEQVTQTFWPSTPSHLKTRIKNSIYLRGCCSGCTKLALLPTWCGAVFSSRSQVNPHRIMFQMYTSTIVQHQFHFFFIRRGNSLVWEAWTSRQAPWTHMWTTIPEGCTCWWVCSCWRGYYHVGQELMWGDMLKSENTNFFKILHLVPTLSLFTKIWFHVPSRVKIW